jgi:hypothetical protein
MVLSATFSAQPDAAALLAQAEYETGLHDMLNIFADRRGFYPTLLDEPDQEYPAVEPHIMLSRVWNALAEQAERGTAPVPGG